jgi:hypothetical protein
LGLIAFLVDEIGIDVRQLVEPSGFRDVAVLRLGAARLTYFPL